MGTLNHKRRTAYWEPTYMPELVETEFRNFDWNLSNSEGPKFSVCSAAALKVISKYSVTPIENATFNICDFTGNFDFSRVTFKKCVFENCDFGRSRWENAKFSNCTFRRCSFSTASFLNVQFIKCGWHDMGMSAEEMVLEHVLISNPGAFLSAAYTNMDVAVLKQKGRSVEYQVSRLEHTKVKVARILMGNLEKLGDDDAFYEAVKVLTYQISKAKIQRARYDLKSKKGSILATMGNGLLSTVLPLEWTMLNISGWINGWGGRVGRAAACGIGVMLCFATIYYFSGWSAGVGSALLSGLEITLLVGFTKYTDLDTGMLRQTVVALNMVLGLWWYAVFVPTVINRISRVKL